MDRTTRTRLLAAAIAAISLLVAAPAAHAVDVHLTVTGAEGRDNVGVGLENPDVVVFRPAVSVVVTEAAAGVKPTTSCTPENDPLTGRPRLTRCDLGTRHYDLTVDLRGGNDAFSVNLAHAGLDAVSVAGGAGDDALAVSAGGTSSFKGGDGDDTLATFGISTSPAALDGGAGRDLVDYLGVDPSPGIVPGGVTASLATGRATLLIGTNAAGQTIVRQDSLTGVERLSGTPNGDILTGGPAADELLGDGGPDNIDGGDGNDVLAGEDGDDQLAGGKGTDSLDGGTGVDQFLAGPGGDTLLARDGFAEKMSCLDRETVVNDLVDSLASVSLCLGVSTAQAKHRFDTALSRKRLTIGTRRRVPVRVSCPRRKPDRCAGRLRLRLGGPRGTVLAARHYRLRPGRSVLLRLRLSAREAARARGHRVTLEAREVDGDGRRRLVTRSSRLRR